jgi:hypothetical protein
MSTNNPNQPATGASEAQETMSDAAESAQPTAAPETTAVESAATATAQESASAGADGDNLEQENAEYGEMGMEDFGKILAEHEQSHRSEISENEVVKGRVVKITDQAVIIDRTRKAMSSFPGLTPCGCRRGIRSNSLISKARTSSAV